MRLPEYDIDFYSDEFILDPIPHYAKMRELGPVVWLPQNQVYALPQYKECTEALRQPLKFISSQGVSLNPKVNDILKGSTLNSDPPAHDKTRSVTAAPLLPGALKEVEPRIRQAAEGLIDRLCERRQFDAISDFATYLPLTTVAELVGLPEKGQASLLKWASATFNLFANENERAKEAFDDLKDLRDFLDEYGKPEMLKPGGWAKRIFEVGPERGISLETCAQLMRDYINPSLDTTISATGQIIKMFADNPDQWAMLRAKPELVRNAIEEAVRLATPIRAFSRYVAEDCQIAGVPIAEGSRILAIYASANRDERKYENPDKFDITRDVHDHVGFGHGVHMCMGMHLARLEMVSLLEALMERVGTFEVISEPTIAMNNTIRAYASLPVRVKLLDKLAKKKVQTVSEQSPWLDVTISSCEQVGKNILSLSLSATDGTKLPSSEAGSHVDVHIKSGLIRQYSLSNNPNQSSSYRLGILKDDNSRGGSAWVHDNFKAGSQIRIGRPRNNFPLAEQAKHSILFAGGIGITPMLSMAHHLTNIGARFELHYCARSRENLAFFEELLGFGASIHFHLDDGPEDQKLNIDTVLQKPGPDRHLYVCGPNGFMDFVVDAAARNNWVKETVHLERFGAEVDTDGAPFTLVAHRSGKTFEIQPGETISSRLIEASIDVQMSCQSGVCGTCLTKVIEGTPDHRDFVQTDLEKASNARITLCCSRSKTKRLVVDI